MPVSRSVSRAPPPPRPWRRSSVPVRRRSAASPSSPRTSTVVEMQLPGPCGRSAARAESSPPAGGRRLHLSIRSQLHFTKRKGWWKGSEEKRTRRVCPVSCLRAANLVAEHVGASSRHPRHPFPALMAWVNPALCLCTAPYIRRPTHVSAWSQGHPKLSMNCNVIDQGICCCTQWTYNNRSKEQRGATAAQKRRSPYQCTAAGESLW